jgi:2-polyprenyl-3-methyl-5-hydroxy-6-metoxy-1,4-benzoquinol methylase
MSFKSLRDYSYNNIWIIAVHSPKGGKMSGAFSDTCFICGGKMGYYFTKYFPDYGLGDVDYWKCDDCGFVMSKTHCEMDDAAWNALNFKFHDGYQGKEKVADEFERLVQRRDNRQIAQADAVAHMAGTGMVPGRNKWLDYGCGDGKLSDLLKEKDLEVLKYDKYMSNERAGYLGQDSLGKYDLLINCAVFEHILSYDSLSEMFGLISDGGVLALHTLACEEIPRDPKWFYLLPVHTAFYTNRAMKILFEKFDFKSSIYNVPSRMWFWFRDFDKEKLDAAAAPDRNEWFFKEGFMDYWK